MAKAITKTSAAKVKKAAPAKPTTISSDPLQKAGIEALKKLQSLNIQQQLQADLEWCLGSYTHDKNPTGLIEAVNRTVSALKGEQAKKTKGVTAKFIGDLEKALSPA
jgi:hypothetical protein